MADKITTLPAAAALTGAELLELVQAGANVQSPSSALARNRLTANRTYYVRTDGSDANTGLVDSAGGAFLTIQKAVDVICQTLDLAGFVPTIQVRDGTYTAGALIGPTDGGGTSGIALVGNTATPANCIISTTSADCLRMLALGGRMTVNGFTLQTTTSGNCLRATNRSEITFSNIVFGACAGVHILADGHARIGAATGYTISGGAINHVSVGVHSDVTISTGTVTITGTPAFSLGFANLNGSASADIRPTFSGSATGARFAVTRNSGLRVTSLTSLPGNLVGTLDASSHVDGMQRQVLVPAAGRAKIGAVAGWAVNGANNLPFATLPASQTNSTLVIPIDDLNIGELVTDVAVTGQVESGGNTVTMTLDVRKVTAAAADFTDASLGTDTLGAGVTADTILSSANLGVAGLTETLAEGEFMYALITGTTTALTDIVVAGLVVTITRSVI